MCQLVCVCRKTLEKVNLFCGFPPLPSSLRLSLQEVLSSYNREVTELLRSKVGKERSLIHFVFNLQSCIMIVHK